VRGLVTRLDPLSQDLTRFVESIKSEFPSVPIFLVGESLGGSIALFSTMPERSLHSIISGLVLLAPACMIQPEACNRFL
jgi:alpha-beta hydrolase superfamily lysophospholipase